MKRIVLSILLLSLYLQVFPQWTSLYQDDFPYVSLTSYDSVILGGSSFWGESDLLISIDYGNTWTGYNPFSGAEGVISFTTVDSMVYACTTTGIFRTSKGTFNWLDYSEGLNETPILKLVANGSILFAADYCGEYNSKVYKRMEGDTAWVVILENSPVGEIFDIDYDGEVLALAGYNGIAESYNLGAEWTMWNGYNFEMTSVKIKGDTIIAASKGGIYRKIISLGNISKVCDGLLPIWNPYGYEYYGEFESFHQVGDHIFVCGETGVYKLQSNGWYWQNAGLGNWTYAMSDNSIDLVAAVGYLGIKARPLDELILHSSDFNTQQESVRVFPNPASERVSITSESVILSIVIYDNHGKLIKYLSPLTNHISISVGNYKPGLYLIQAITHEKESFEKIIVAPH